MVHLYLCTRRNYAAGTAKSRTRRSRARPDRGTDGKAHVEGAQGRRRAEGYDTRRSAGGNRPPCLRGQDRSLLAADAEGDRAVQGPIRDDPEGHRQPQPEGEEEMKTFLTLIAAAGLSGTGLAAPVIAQMAPASPEQCLHVRTSFDFVVHAPYSVTAPLFGPEGERAWAGKHWDPEFIFPKPARPQTSSDVEGAVFTVRHGPLSAVWVNTL